MLAGPAPPKKRIPKLTRFIGGKGDVGTESQGSLPVRRASSMQLLQGATSTC